MESPVIPPACATCVPRCTQCLREPEQRRKPGRPAGLVGPGLLHASNAFNLSSHEPARRSWTFGRCRRLYVRMNRAAFLSLTLLLACKASTSDPPDAHHTGPDASESTSGDSAVDVVDSGERHDSGRPHDGGGSADAGSACARQEAGPPFPSAPPRAARGARRRRFRTARPGLSGKWRGTSLSPRVDGSYPAPPPARAR